MLLGQAAPRHDGTSIGEQASGQTSLVNARSGLVKQFAISFDADAS
jgi:hypothetical protein